MARGDHVYVPRGFYSHRRALNERSLFPRWARQQRVRRPFEALLKMDSGSRCQIAEQLGMELEHSWDEAVANSNYDLGLDERPERTPVLATEAEASIIIGMDRRG